MGERAGANEIARFAPQASWDRRPPGEDRAGGALQLAQPGIQAENLRRFRTAVAGALAHLEARRQEINDLNVFPVADGDTGDNMALTLRAVLHELDRLEAGAGEHAPERLDREEIVESVARAALLGARGNSGVILSQLIRGAAEELASRPGELIDPALIGAAMLKAANRAYESVREPAEGTILTAAREMAHQLVADVAHASDQARLGSDASARRQDELIASALERALAAGEETVRRGPELLAPLREAGVVDAGAYGLTIIFAGVIAALRGTQAPSLRHHAPARITHPQHSSSTYRYCTNFAVTGTDLVAAHFIAPLEALGDSVLVVGDAHTLKIHVHTNDPERAIALLAPHGEVSRLDVADMHAQERERSLRLDASARAQATAERVRCSALAVVDGEGFAAIYEELGVHTLRAGASLNPSTYELLAAIHAVEAEEVIVLPCSPNVLLAAEKAAELSEKQVAVLPAFSQQAGVAGALALERQRSLEDNRAALGSALAALRTGAVGEAARDDPQGRFRRGEAVGLIGERTVAWGEPQACLVAIAAELAQEAELLSVFCGANAPLDERASEELLASSLEVELEVRAGGQLAYWWLLSAE
jgi:DAK2 domain fusion protein YloV